jgi:hypothetical protein
MIDELRLSVLLRGESFSPKEAEEITGIKLSNKFELGEISSRGRYRDKPLPYGTAHLEVPGTVSYDDKLMWLVSILESHLETWYSCGAEKTRIYAGYLYKDQCNFGLTKEEILALSKLNIDFDISCYDTSGDE